MGQTSVQWLRTKLNRLDVRYCISPCDEGKESLGKQDHCLLLLHGLGCSSEAWLPSMRCFSARPLLENIIAPDFPGYGKSQIKGGALGIEALADWAIRLLDLLGYESADVAGNSMGCQVAMAMARHHPDRVSSLSLLGPTSGVAQVPLWRYAIGLLADGFGESASYNKLLLHMYLQMGLVRYVTTVRKMMKDDPLQYAAEIRCPALVLRGGHDRIVSEKMAQDLSAALPCGEYQALDSTAHAAEYNTPELFVSAVLEFLQRNTLPDNPILHSHPPHLAQRNN